MFATLKHVAPFPQLFKFPYTAKAPFNQVEGILKLLPKIGNLVKSNMAFLIPLLRYSNVVVPRELPQHHIREASVQSSQKRPI